MVDVAGIFKAYDVRGVVPDQLDESVARATGAAFVEVLDVLGGPGAVVLGYDMRPSSPALAAAFAEGVASTGADVIDIGLASTAHLHPLVDLSGIRPLTVVVDAGNGMGGHTVPAVFAEGPVTIVPMYFELDGSFPNHEANPLDPKNLVDLQAKVRETGADLGLAF